MEMRPQLRQQGFTYVEMMLSVTITSLIMLALMGLLNTATEAGDSVRSRNDLTREARFALETMARSVGHSRKLLLPQRDKPATNWPENIRQQTVPASPPIGDSTLATAVLAVSLPAYIDLDDNDIPDADNDGDGLLDEDLPNDNYNDFGEGVYGIDDGGNGQVDEGFFDNDNDEALSVFGEDPINGVDDDGDNNIDEDPQSDMNADGCAGVCGVDDDGDGAIDEGSVDDDDEDGTADEDWYDPLVFFLDNGVLKQRTPVPWDETGNGSVTGRDFILSDLVTGVTRLRFERVDSGNSVDLIDITLELTDPQSGEFVSLQTRVRVGGAL